MDNGNNIMSFGLATLGIILHSAISKSGSTIVFYIMLLIIPILAFFILSMWFSEQQRISRASFYITRIERKIAAMTKKNNLLEWEHWLRNSKKIDARVNRHFRTSEYSGIAIFLFLMLTSPLLSFTFENPPATVNTSHALLLVYLLLTILLSTLFNRVKSWRRELDDYASDSLIKKPRLD